MKRQLLRYFIVASVCLVVGAFGFAAFSRRDDPAFNGRRLSTSVYDLLEPNSGTYAASSNVIAQLGTQAVPYLKEMASRGESGVERMAAKFNLPLPAHRMMLGRQLAASRAARILGTNAMPLTAELMPLTQSPIGSIRQAALEAIFATFAMSRSATPPVLTLITNTMATDPFLDCRLTAARMASACGVDSTEMINLVVGNIGSGTKFTGEAARKFAAELRALAPEKVLEDAVSRFSRSDNPEVRRFVAICAPVCLASNSVAVEIVKRLAGDTNQAVARAATNALAEMSVKRP